MKITKKHLSVAAEKHILTKEQADALLHFLKSQPGVGPSFDLTHVLYYLGGLIAIGAMTLFMTLGWESFGGWGIFFISLAYAGAGLKLTDVFRKKGYGIASGICATFVVALTPLAIYGLQQALGWWPGDTVYREYHMYIKWNWLFMELGTLAVGVIIAWRHRYPFLIMPIAVTLWYMSMDVAAMIAGGTPDFELRALVSMYFGLAMVLLAFWVDIRARKSGDYAFWLYIFGLIAFWGGMTAQQSDSELSKFFYFCINLLLIGVGVVLMRRVFVVFGAIGTIFYLGHLASNVFRDSWLFPIALSAIGLCIIYLGVLWQRNESEITKRVHALLPNQLRELLQKRE
ncbi:MAG: DUF2157 domain-containing protein [Acidiferrobacterales bacterium]